MIKNLSKLLTLPDYNDFTIPIESEDGYSIVAVINVDKYFAFGILFNTFRFHFLTFNEIENITHAIDFNKNIGLTLMKYLINSITINELKKQKYIGYMYYNDFLNFKENNKHLFKK